MLDKIFNLVQRVIIIWLTIIFGCVYVLKLAKDVLRKGPRSIFNRRIWESRPPVLDNEDLGKHQYARLKNVTIHYVIKGPHDAPLMLFLHGFPECWYSWRHQIREFSSNYRVVAIDMKGFGESSKPTGVQEYTLPQLAEEINQLLEYLGYKKCVLVGHDWGGLLAWTVASLHSHLVERLIICNAPHPRAYLHHFRRTPTQVMQSGYIFAFQWPVVPEVYMLRDGCMGVEEVLAGEAYGAKPGTFTTEDMDGFKYYFSSHWDMVGAINYYRAMWADQEEFSKANTVLTCPTMTIWGDADAFLQAEMAEIATKFAKDYTVKYIQNRSHWIQQEEPDTVNTHIKEFLNCAKLE